MHPSEMAVFIEVVEQGSCPPPLRARSGKGVGPVPLVNQIRTYWWCRRELGGKECARLVRRRGRSAHLSPKISASVSRCDNSCTTVGCDGGVARRTQQRGQGIPVGSNRSAFQHMRFATGNAAMSAGREWPWIEVCG